jgi:hypothetical protein
LMPTIVTAAAIVIFHTLTIVSARFHIPLEPILAIWGAAGLAMFATRIAAGNPGLHRSRTARHHVVGVRVEERLPVVHLVSRLGNRRRSRMHFRKDQAAS